MSLSAWILSAGFGAMVLLGFPFGTALMLTTALVLVTADIDPVVLAQTMIGGTQSFSLMAIPFFMLAGEIMLAGGLSQRLVNVASVFVRHLPGGLGHVTVLSALFFAAISGSAPATTAAIGSIMIPAMAERGYDKSFATALAVSAGVLAPLIPPSIAFVIWGIIAQQSIAKLFISGILPGLAIAFGLHVICYVHARRHGIPTQARATWAEVRVAVRESKWALLAPVIVLGGIYGGVFTPTEAAVVSCVYGLVIGFFVEKKLTLRGFYKGILSAMRVTVMVMFIIIAAAGFGVLVAQEQVAVKFAGWLAANVSQRWVMLLGLNVFFTLIAAVMDEVSLLVILGPLMIETARQYAVDPIHFGAIVVVNMAIGMAVPPMGYCLFVGMAIARVTMWQVARAIWPMVVVMLIVLMLTTYLPGFALALQGK